MCKNPGIIRMAFGKMNIWVENQMRGNLLVSFANACWAALLGQDTTKLQLAQFL